MPPFTEADLRPGDWIKFCDPASGGVVRLAEMRAMYPHGRDPMADTSVGCVPLAWIVEVRPKPPNSPSEKGRMNVVRALRGEARADHECDRKGKPERVVDESTDPPVTRIAPTCSVCGVPPIF